MHSPLILASASPRRADLLSQLGLHFNTCSPDIDERPLVDESPQQQAVRLAQQKALAGWQQLSSEDANITVLAADTLLSFQGRSLGKPVDFADFNRMMQNLAGREHEVFTAVCVKHQHYENVICVGTRVWFAPMTAKEISAYWQSGEPQDKAGGYAIQGIGGQFVQRIEGSVSAVIGLPLYETKQLLVQAGVLV